MTNNQIQKYDDFQFGDLKQTDIQVIHETIAKDCTEPQFRLFMTIAKSLGANPILNEIYPTVIQGKLIPQFGIGFYVKQARKNNDYKGYDVQLVHEQDEFKMHQERAEDGRYYVVIDEHSWGFPRGKIIGCYAFAYRDGFSPFSVIMGIEEVEHYQKSGIGMQKTMWTNQLPDMFKKHTAKRALNAAFGLDLDDEQIASSPADKVESFERKEINPEVTEQKETKKTIKRPAEEKAPPASEPEPQDDKSTADQMFKEIGEKIGQLGFTKETKSAFFKDNGVKFKDAKNPTISEMTGLIKLLDMAIEEKAAAQDDELLGGE